MRMHRTILVRAMGLWLWLACTLGAAVANPNVEVRATVSPQRLYVGDLFSYTIEVETDQKGDILPPSMSASDGYTPEQGPDTSQQLSHFAEFRNGRSVSTTRYTIRWVYQLRATKAGSFEIPAPKFRLPDGTLFEGAPTRFEVKDVAPGAVLSARTEYEEINQLLEGRLFTRAEAPERALTGEPVLVRTYLYRDPSLAASSITRIDTTSDSPGQDFVLAHKEELWLSRGLSPEPAEWQGKRYERSLLHEAYYLPTKSGELTLQPPMLVMGIAARSNIGLPTTIRATLRVHPLKVQVQAPPAPAPGTLLQVVGDYRVTATTDRTELPQFEFLTLKLELNGVGSLAGVSAPKLPAIGGLELVDTRASGSDQVSRGKMRATRTFEYTYRAADPGRTSIPELVVEVVDPATREAKPVKLAAREINITPSTAQAAVIAAPAATAATDGGPVRQEARTLGTDVAYIDRAKVTRRSDASASPFYLSPLFLGLNLAIVAVAAGAGFLQRQRLLVDPDSPAEQARRWARESQEALKSARGLIAGAARDQFYQSLAQGIKALAAAQLRLPPQGLTSDQIAAGLAQRGCPQPVIDQVRGALQRADEARFSPLPDTEDRRRADLDAAEQALTALLRSGVRP
jgi:hypothetical protein